MASDERLPRFGPLLSACATAVACLLAHAALGWDEPASDPAPALVAQIDEALAALDDDDFARRTEAGDRLRGWADDRELSSFLARRFAQALQSGSVSIEVRSHIEALAKHLPESAGPADVSQANPAEIGQLLSQLDADQSATRATARERLKSMLARTELIAPLWLELKNRASDPGLTAATRRELEPLLDAARQAWLNAAPAAVKLPDISDDTLERWIEQLFKLDETDASERFRRHLVERELLDAIARDDTRERLLAILERRILAAGDAADRTTLQQIADFAKPALAAEVWGHELGNWEHRQHVTVQYLIVGLPQFNEMARQATHFDRIDEQTAHCVSGNSLKPGDYPVRVAIPHPEPPQEVMFYLTNLPTARRRLAYEYHVRRDEGTRLREITDRTLEYFLDHDQVLNETEVLLLAQLDPESVSRFVGSYFQRVPDRKLVTSISELGTEATVHRAICHMISRVGTRTAVPALEQLARSGKLEPTVESPYHIAWIAALALAQRDPWPGVDEWLAKLVDSNTALVMHADIRPELGASAAALLVDRHGASTRPFGLVTAGEAATERLRFIGYRFENERHREEVKRWWAKQKAANEGAAAQAP
ncbi:MAG TPA: hypothetical protein VL175_01420 [Pirellulales bacterium]|jgi:hypothetical protein|nr:hypothetical protein [Pirellulales bacterium]